MMGKTASALAQIKTVAPKRTHRLLHHHMFAGKKPNKQKASFTQVGPVDILSQIF